MYMTKYEIGTMYRQASDKSKQIRIMAQLNACKREDIAKILIELGYKLRLVDDKIRYGRYKKIGQFAWPDKKIKPDDLERRVDKYIADRYNKGEMIHIIAKDLHMDHMIISEMVQDCRDKGLIK